MHRSNTALCFISLAAVSCGQEVKDSPAPTITAGPVDCGDVRSSALQSQSSAVINGEDTFDGNVVALTEGQVLAIGVVQYEFVGWRHACTATLIAEDVVLTAAHCVIDEGAGVVHPASQLRFAMGYNATFAEGFVGVSQVVVHQGADLDAGAAHDVALLLLNEPAANQVADVTPIPVNCAELDLVGEDVQNVGYGCTDNNCHRANNLRNWIVERVVDFGSFEMVVDGEGVYGVCFGDSGGPSLWTIPGHGVRVVGTLSWGDTTCTAEAHYAATHNECGFLEEYVALPPEPATCDDVDSSGECDGEVLTHCANNISVVDDCSAVGRICGESMATGNMECLDACLGESAPGRCDGDTVIWCEDGEIKTRRCGDCGQTCGWSTEHWASYCL